MVASLHEMAQLTHGFEVSMDAVVSMRSDLKRDWPEMGLPVPSLNDFVVRAAALALREHPGLNATVIGAEIHLLPDIHVGMAVAVPGGLVVPVVRHADRLSLQDLTDVTRTLAGKAREGASLPELEGGTFAVTSLGTYGVDFFTPVISPGNGRDPGGRTGARRRSLDRRRPAGAYQVLTLSLTFDHRAVDGAPAASTSRRWRTSSPGRGPAGSRLTGRSSFVATEPCPVGSAEGDHRRGILLTQVV